VTRRRRILTEEERALFESELGDAALLKPAPRAPSPKLKSQKVRKPEPVQAPTPNNAGVLGLDGRTAGRLDRGELEPEARLDLHGLTERAAHAALITFVRAARARKLRLVLIVTGKGGATPTVDEPFDLGLDTRRRGVLRRMTPRWLREPELSAFVADIRDAHRRHGGSGALYVYLRRSR
jgi:hypothetical protein